MLVFDVKLCFLLIQDLGLSLQHTLVGWHRKPIEFKSFDNRDGELRLLVLQLACLALSSRSCLRLKTS